VPSPSGTQFSPLIASPHLPFGFPSASLGASEKQGRLGLMNAVASRLHYFDVFEPVGVIGLDDYVGGDGVAGLELS
jgi:hypothetical protein